MAVGLRRRPRPSARRGARRGHRGWPLPESPGHTVGNMPDFGAWGPADWSALSAAVTAAVAVVAAAFAFLQVRHARLLREEQAQPFVVVDFESSPVWRNAIELVIENIGKTVATNVRVSFDPPLQSTQQAEGYDLSKSVLLTQGIPTMPPSKRVATMFELSHDRKDSGLPLTYTAKVDFADSRGKPQKSLTYVLDLNFLYGLRRFREYGVHDAAKAVQEMRDAMNKWTDHFDGIRVYVVDEDARHFEERWQMEKGGDVPTMGNPLPARRPAPSRFDKYKEPVWKRMYWSIRQEVDRRKRLAELEAKVAQRPDLASELEPQLARLRSTGLLASLRRNRG